MQWDDLQVLLAVHRGGSLVQAARLLRVNKSTVSRRLAVLERALDVALTERRADGRMQLTSAGGAAARRAEAMEDAARGLVADLRDTAPGFAGRVRLTAVPLVVNHLLLPHVPDLLAEAPGVTLELVAEARDLDLLAGDADIAVRLARPRQGGQEVLSKRIGGLAYGCFARPAQGANLPWIGYEPHMQYLSHAKAITQLAARSGERLSALSVNDAETLLHAVQAGHGKTLLPRTVGVQAGLEEIPQQVNLPVRDVWVLVRRELRGLERVASVMDWLDSCLG